MKWYTSGPLHKGVMAIEIVLQLLAICNSLVRLYWWPAIKTTIPILANHLLKVWWGEGNSDYPAGIYGYLVYRWPLAQSDDDGLDYLAHTNDYLVPP